MKKPPANPLLAKLHYENLDNLAEIQELRKYISYAVATLQMIQSHGKEDCHVCKGMILDVIERGDELINVPN